MTKGMFALLLAGALTVPHVPALGNDSTQGLGQAHSASRHVALVG